MKASYFVWAIIFSIINITNSQDKPEIEILNSEFCFKNLYCGPGRKPQLMINVLVGNLCICACTNPAIGEACHWM